MTNQFNRINRNIFPGLISKSILTLVVTPLFAALAGGYVHAQASKVGDTVTSQAYTTEGVDMGTTSERSLLSGSGTEIRMESPSKKRWSLKYKSNHNFKKANFESGNFDNVGTLGSAISAAYTLNAMNSISLIQKFDTLRENGENKFVEGALGFGIDSKSLTEIGGYGLYGAATYYLPTGKNDEKGKNEFRTTFGWERPVAAKTTLSLGAQQRFYFYSKDLVGDQDRYLIFESADISYEVNKYFSWIGSVGHGQIKTLIPAERPSQTDEVWLSAGFAANFSDNVGMKLVIEHDEDIRNTGKGSGLFSNEETKYHLTVDAKL
jgi:hypothetical protein